MHHAEKNQSRER